jgi:hypothetical protein
MEYTIDEMEKIILDSKVGKFFEYYWLSDSDFKNLLASARGAFRRRLQELFPRASASEFILWSNIYSKPRVYYEINDGIQFLRFAVDFSAITTDRFEFVDKFGTSNVLYGIILLTPERDRI